MSRKILALAAVGVVLSVAFFAASLVGAAGLSPAATLVAITHPFSASIDAKILWEVRLPRIFCGLLVGAALGMAGCVVQTLVRNPIADPFITGVSAGASVSAAIGIALGVHAVLIPAMGTASGLATAAVVVALSLRAGRIDSQRLILSGIFVSSFLAAIVTLVLTRLSSFSAAEEILVWLAGTLAGHGWSDFLVALPYAAAGTLLLVLSTDGLNAMRLGEERAAAVGAAIARTQWLVVVGSTLLTAAAVALSGIVGFVGLLSPHAARRFVGSDVRWSLPMSALCGATLVTVADLIARTALAPSEIPLGALLSLFGVPALFVIVRHERRPRATVVAAHGAWRRFLRLGKSVA